MAEHFLFLLLILFPAVHSIIFGEEVVYPSPAQRATVFLSTEWNNEPHESTYSVGQLIHPKFVLTTYTGLHKRAGRRMFARIGSVLAYEGGFLREVDMWHSFMTNKQFNASHLTWGIVRLMPPYAYGPFMPCYAFMQGPEVAALEFPFILASQNFWGLPRHTISGYYREVKEGDQIVNTLHHRLNRRSILRGFTRKIIAPVDVPPTYDPDENFDQHPKMRAARMFDDMCHVQRCMKRHHKLLEIPYEPFRDFYEKVARCYRIQDVGNVVEPKVRSGYGPGDDGAGVYLNSSNILLGVAQGMLPRLKYEDPKIHTASSITVMPVDFGREEILKFIRENDHDEYAAYPDWDEENYWY